MEVNPRLQVEHTITESIASGIDLVRIQLELAQGFNISRTLSSNFSGNPEQPPALKSLQLRVTAEDVSHDWSLSVGKISAFRFPSGNGVRVDSHLLPSQSTVIGTDFDSLIAKIIITAPTWEMVVQKAKRALADTYIEGVKTSLDILRGIVASKAFAEQECDTQWLESNLPSCLESGNQIGQVSRQNKGTATNSATSAVAAASNVLFRKGDAWSISLTPETSSGSETAQAIPSHLQLTKVLRNEFPTSLSASILYSSAASPTPTSYTLNLSTTTSSFGSISNAATHRRGDPGNQNHVVLPFSGKLMELLFDVGDEVRKGDCVAVVRQMKMELEIRASKGGKIIWIYEGEIEEDVGEGVLLAEIEGSGSKL